MIPGAFGSEITKIPPMDEVLRRHNFETVDWATSMPSLNSSPWMPNQLNASNDEHRL
jgi:hypothetical protein